MEQYARAIILYLFIIPRRPYPRGGISTAWALIFLRVRFELRKVMWTLKLTARKIKATDKSDAAKRRCTYYFAGE